MQPSHSSNSSIYDSNPWRNLSDSAFASSQNSLTGSVPRDCLSHSSEELNKISQSPVRSIYRNYLQKEQPFSRLGNNLSRQSSISNLITDASKNQVETEKVAQLVFLVKDLLEKFTKLNENVDYLLTRLTESLDQKLANSNVETQRYIKVLFENLTHDVLVSVGEKARIVELENVIKEKNNQIMNLKSKLGNARGHEIENIMSSLKTTITSELQSHLTLLHQMTIEMVKQNSLSKHVLECKMDRLLSSNKEIIVNEIDGILKKQLTDFQHNCLTVGHLGNDKPINATPRKNSQTRPPFENMFEVRETFEQCIPNSKRLSPLIHGTLLPKMSQKSRRTSIKLATPRQLKSIRHTRHPRSLIKNGSKSKPVIWSYRGQCNSTQPSEISFASENCDSISEGSSPSYSISLFPMHEESPNVSIIDHFNSGLTF